MDRKSSDGEKREESSMETEPMETSTGVDTSLLGKRKLEETKDLEDDSGEEAMEEEEDEVEEEEEEEEGSDFYWEKDSFSMAGNIILLMTTVSTQTRIYGKKHVITIARSSKPRVSLSHRISSPCTFGLELVWSRSGILTPVVSSSGTWCLNVLKNTTEETIRM
ncbi:uncharacterized protein LOC108862882 [Raphanus sativus]|uniref:Uncharacterized protein LOC108862882 n=1 Tax=Raphanus sativus TaxID=3726 RepID=A0A9W3BSK0_RAPSA|nr:uncharacterized protein LOC108862882 [Raphanus sativus]